MQFPPFTRPIIVLLVEFVVMAASAIPTSAADNVSPLDLVSNNAALCVQIPHLNETWATFENGPFMDRLRSIPAWQRLLESRGFQHVQMVEDHVARLTGQKLSVQLRALVGKSLVLAVYVPAEGPPRGILIGEAVDRSAIQTAFATSLKLEPTAVASFKTHRGVRYQQRKKHSTDDHSLFVATLDRLVAISDQESLIQDAIDRFAAASGSSQTSDAADSLAHSKVFLRNEQRHRTNGAAYLYINARPWDRGLEEASRNEQNPINPAAIWKHVSAVSACLQLDQGIVCETIVELETSRLPSGWSEFVATAATNAKWTDQFPPESLLAIGGHLELAPLLRHLVSHMPSKDQTELAKNRRIAQSLLGGHELLDSVLPSLARNFSGCVVARQDDHTKRMALDGAASFTLNAPGDAKLLHDIVPGLDAGMNALAAILSAEGPGVVTVERQQDNTTQLRWLSSSAPFPIAFGVKDEKLVIAGSLERLRRSFELRNHDGSQARLFKHAERFFPQANQLVWFDTALTRELLRQHGPDLARFFAHGSNDESIRLANHFEQVQPALSLIDSMFIAGRIESDHIRVVFGGGLDAK